MNCACINMYIEEYTDTVSSIMVKARKEHTCQECGKKILKGDQYERYAGKNDGMFFVHKTCLDCLSIRDAFFCNGWCWGTVMDELSSYVYDVDGEIPSSCLLSLTSGAREKVLDLIDYYWQEDEYDD